MEIEVASERASVIPAVFTWPQLRERAWDKKTQVFSGGIAGLLSRPKSEEVEIVSSELRYEPFWQIVAGTRYVYERKRVYRIAVAAPEVQTVTINEQPYPIAPGKDAKEPRGFTVSGLEYCEQNTRQERFFDAVSGAEHDFSGSLKHPASEIPDLASFSMPEALIVPPTVRAMTVVRTVMSSLFQGIEADRVIEERVAVDTVALYFKPTYAVEYRWKPKDRTAVVEFDGMTGEMRNEGRMIQDQIKGVLSQDLLFDVTADAVGMFVPGGSIAIKLARAGARRAIGE